MEFYSSVIEEVEKINYSKYLSEFKSKFVTFRDKAIEQGDKKAANLFQYEIEILSLCTKNPFVKENYSQRFVPLYEYKDGTKWPNIEGFTEEQINYYEERLKVSNNVFLKSRYADFLFEHGDKFGSLNKYQISQILVPSLLEIADAHLEKGNLLQFVLSLSRAVEVSLRMQIEKFIQSSLILLEKAIVEFEKIKNYRWILELSELIRNIVNSKKSNLVTEELKELCFDVLNKGRISYWENKEFHLHRSFCEEVLKWKKIKNMSDDEVDNLLLEIGRSYEEEALYQHGREEKSNIVKAHFYELAMRHYANIGKTEKVNEMKVLIRRAYEELERSDELSAFSSEFSIPTEALENILKPYLEGEKKEILDRISKAICFIPKLSEVERLTRNLMEQFPLQFLVGRSVIDDGKKIDHGNSNEDDSYRFAFSQSYMLHLQFNLELIIVNLFNRLIVDKELSSEDVINKLKSWPLLSPKNLPLIEVGIEAFFKGDYVSSIHILVPQFESTLRRMFSLAGYPTTSIKKGTAQHEETFNEFLNRADIKEALGEHIHKFIQMVMVEQTGLNLRNKVAHGLISFSECNRSLNILVIYLFLLLTVFRIDVKEDNEE